ncbi:hypothetical protein [Mycobacterium sp. NPDC050853]|uniref:hypothetical protein n=1 Tax=Mycobacterium sp. NPDC050853 TaxID=3155160 RepID=UPI0033D16193
MAALHSDIDEALAKALAAQGWIKSSGGGLIAGDAAVDRVIDLPTLRNELISSLGLRQERGIVHAVSGTWPNARYSADSAMGRLLDGAPGAHEEVRLVSEWHPGNTQLP